MNQLTAAVRDEVRRRAADVVAFTQELVRVPSETHPPGGDEGPVQRVVEARLRALGLDVDVFEPWSVEGVEQHEGWWPGLDFRDRPNVVGVWDGAAGGRSLILNGHIDVVSAEPLDKWTVDPYGGEVRDGWLYGRGSVDMKGGVAAMIMAVDVLKGLGWQPAGKVIVESVVNEELGGYDGALGCVVKGYEADAAIITEPTDLRIAPSSKGGQVYRAVVQGKSAHSAVWPEGVSALDKALLVKDALRAWEALRAEECADVPFFGRDSAYPRPAYSDTVWSLRAGDPAVMSTPETAELLFWVDHLPGEPREETMQRFEAFVRERTAADAWLAEHPVELTRSVMRPFTGTAVDPEHAVVGALERAAEAAGRPTCLWGMPATGDGMIFNLYSSTPAYYFGPGSARYAHAPDERLEVEQLMKAVEILALTIVDFCG